MKGNKIIISRPLKNRVGAVPQRIVSAISLWLKSINGSVTSSSSTVQYRPVQFDFDDNFFLLPNLSPFSYMTTHLSSVMQQLFAFRLVI